jgi:hypothetical protein
MEKVYKVTGRTFEHRDAIKALEGDWDPAAKCWYVPITLYSQKLRDTAVRLGRLDGLEIEVVDHEWK